MAAHPFYLMTLLERFSKLVHAFVGERTLGLEPHALHLVEVLHRRRSLLDDNDAKTKRRRVWVKSACWTITPSSKETHLLFDQRACGYSRKQNLFCLQTSQVYYSYKCVLKYEARSCFGQGNIWISVWKMCSRKAPQLRAVMADREVCHFVYCKNKHIFIQFTLKMF